MQSDLIILSEYCRVSEVEPTFISLLEEFGLIEISRSGDEQYIHESQMKNLEIYTRLYYDLSINMEGIDVISNMLEDIESMQREIQELRYRLKMFDWPL